jgi:hypothetical protein
MPNRIIENKSVSKIATGSISVIQRAVEIKISQEDPIL